MALEGLRAQVYFGADLDDNFDGDDPRTSGADDGLQGDGVHYSISYSRRF